MTRLVASDFYSYYRPSKCELRIYLRHHGEKEDAPSPYDEVLRRLGERHERAHLATFPEFVDLSSGTREERERRSREEVTKKTAVIYQPSLQATTTLSGTECRVLGDPDFLIYDQSGHIIRDSKISRRITEKDHPEILRQLELYGWLYEQNFGAPPARLEVHSGTGEIVEVPYDGGTRGLELLREILLAKQIDTEPYTPVGWTKCNGCGFYGRCWPRAESNRDVALVSGVDQGLAIALHNRGTNTVDDLLAHFDEVHLAEFERPWGKGAQRVGKGASSILRMAQSMASGQETVLENPGVPEHPNYVMFDLEGLPPQLDELEKIYLWGLQVYGEQPTAYLPAPAGFGTEGDREGWEEFLAKAKTILSRHGDLPFVHWHHYERDHLDKYIQRFGDRDGVAARVRQNLVDLLPITQRSIALPLPSYSLKVVEQYIGFTRSMDEYGGQWAMAKYIEATETEDATQRAEVIKKIFDYNREDLAATWAVLNWLKGKRI